MVFRCFRFVKRVRTGVYFNSVSRIGELEYEGTVQDYHLGVLVEQIYALNTFKSVGRLVFKKLDGLVTVCLAIWLVGRFGYILYKFRCLRNAF